MYIGNIEFKNGIFLAPMAGVTDMVFRKICKEMGCDLVYSEMVSAKGMHYNSENTKDMLKVDECERPIAIQIFGSEPDIMSEMAKTLENYPIDIIDINMGCPAPKIVKNGEGSALMNCPDRAAQIVKSVSTASSKPVTVKIRKGFDNSNINAVEIAQVAEKNGAAAVAVHGRTREQYYSGNADWQIIKEVKQSVNIPVIGNGDVDTPEKAKQLIDFSGCDAVMVGRAAQGNPWIFKRTIHYLKTGEILPLPSDLEKVEMAIRHAKMLVEFKGEYIGIREMRKHVCWYTKGMAGSSDLRLKINLTESISEMENILNEYILSL